MLEKTCLAAVVVSLTAFCLTEISAATKERCDQEVGKKIEQCDKQWGFQLSVFQQNLPGYVIDFPQLIKYCRNPNRPVIYRCIADASRSCYPDWRIDLMSRRKVNVELGASAFDYLCSNVELIVQNQDCIQSGIWEISACYRIAAEDFIGQIEEKGSRGDKWARRNSSIKQLGERIERCVYEQLFANCNSQVAKVFRNFLYGTLVYPFSD